VLAVFIKMFNKIKHAYMVDFDTVHVKIWLQFNIYSVPYKLNRKHFFLPMSFKITYSTRTNIFDLIIETFLRNMHGSLLH
jgi:hypothetical protein